MCTGDKSSHTREGGGGGGRRGRGQVRIAEKRWPHEEEGQRINVYCRAGKECNNCYPDNLKSKQ